MQTFDELKARYTSQGVPDAIAANLAGQDLQRLMEENSKLVALAREAESLKKAAGVREFCGVRVSGMREGTVSPSQSKGCKALENAIAVEQSSLGIGDSGETVLYPPKLWIFLEGRTPQYLSQTSCVGLVAAAETMGADKFVEVLKTIGSKDALAAYTADKAERVKAGEVAGRK